MPELNKTASSPKEKKTVRKLESSKEVKKQSRRDLSLTMFKSGTEMDVRCRPGSSSSCVATPVTNAKGYSAGQVVRIINGVRINRADDENSCPTGYKIWSPRNKKDWTIVYNALGQNIGNYPRNPDLIVTSRHFSSPLG